MALTAHLDFVGDKLKIKVAGNGRFSGGGAIQILKILNTLARIPGKIMKRKMKYSTQRAGICCY